MKEIKELATIVIVATILAATIQWWLPIVWAILTLIGVLGAIALIILGCPKGDDDLK